MMLSDDWGSGWIYINSYVIGRFKGSKGSSILSLEITEEEGFISGLLGETNLCDTEDCTE